MSLNPALRYPANITPPDLNYPFGSARNSTAPGAKNGYPYEKDHINDILGYQQALLEDAGIAPSGAPDTALVSQYLDATYAVSGRVASSLVELRKRTGTALGNKTFLTDEFRGGEFKWDPSDLTIKVTEDPQSGIYVAPDADLTGASGVWIRQFRDGHVFMEWFGAKGDLIADDTISVQAAFNALVQGQTLKVRGDKNYLLSSQVDIDQSFVTIDGDGNYLSSKFITIGASFTVFDVSNFGVTFKNIEILGDGDLGNFGENSTVNGIQFKNETTGDCDGRVTGCIIAGLKEGIIHFGANLEIDACTISSGVKGVVSKFFAAKETRDLRIHDNRFHSMGASSPDASVADSVCVEIEDENTSEIYINDNFVDNIKRFCIVNTNAVKINDNIILRTFEDVILITNSIIPTLHRWSITDNYIQGISGAPSNSRGIVVIGDADVIRNGTIETNTIFSTTQTGIHLEKMTACLIAHNTVINPQSSGALNTFAGINCIDVDSCVFDTPCVHKLGGANALAGIKMDAASTGNTILNPQISGNFTKEIDAGLNNIVIDNSTAGLSVFKPGASTVNIDLDGQDAAGTRVTYGRIKNGISSSGAGVEKGRVEIQGFNAGTATSGIIVEEDGKAVIGAKTAAAGDGIIPNGAISFFLNEGGSALGIRIRESDGTLNVLTTQLPYAP